MLFMSASGDAIWEHDAEGAEVTQKSQKEYQKGYQKYFEKARRR